MANINGTTGNDQGSDALVGTQDADVIRGNRGDDLLQGLGGGDELRGGQGNDSLEGGAAIDLLVGGAGDDLLDGGEGDGDIASFDHPRISNGVEANLTTGVATDPFGDTDTLLNIEELVGSSLNDVLTGATDSGSILAGEAGDDTLIGLSAQAGTQFDGGMGDDQITGGASTDDVARYDGDQANFTLALSAEGATLTDRRGSEGTDTLSSVEFLDFTTELPIFGDDPMNLDTFDDASSLTAEQFAPIVELYIAYFNRAPDAIGLNFWASAFARGEVDLAGMAELFFDQAETRSVYASSLNEDGSQITDVTAFVTEIFTNVLGRTPDQGGLDFWVGVLDRGDVTPGSAISSIIEGAKVDAPAGATQDEIDARNLDQQYLSNATDIGVHFAVINGMSDTANADAVMDLLTRSAESVSAAVAQSDQFLAEAQAANGGEFLMPLVGVIDDPFAG